MRKSMKIPQRAGIHIIEHFAGKYWGSASFLMDVAANLTTPERIIILSHPDIDAPTFATEMKNRLCNLNKLPETVGRMVCVGNDGIEDQLFKQEMGLFPGMEMIVLVTASNLSGALKYIYNTSIDQSKWVSIICSVQCGFRKSFMDIMKRECAIGSCITNGFFDTFIYEENNITHTLDGEKIFHSENEITDTIVSTEPIISIHPFHTERVVDTLSR